MFGLLQASADILATTFDDVCTVGMATTLDDVDTVGMTTTPLDDMGTIGLVTTFDEIKCVGMATIFDDVGPVGVATICGRVVGELVANDICVPFCFKRQPYTSTRRHR